MHLKINSILLRLLWTIMSIVWFQLNLFSQTQRLTNPNASVDTIFPLMAWDYVDNEKPLKDMQECGVNLIAFAPASLLNLAQKYNIKCILYDTGILHSFNAPFNSKV